MLREALVKHWRALAVAFLILLFVTTAKIARSNYDKYQAELSTSQQLRNDNALQSSTIATQAFQFNRFNQIADIAGQHAMSITAAAQEKEIEYRVILKSEPTCNLNIPAAISGRLLEYTNSLRASAVHPDTGKSDSASYDAATSGPLTYCQAVLWIDPLLMTIDKANSQLAGIREIESSRQGQIEKPQ